MKLGEYLKQVGTTRDAFAEAIGVDVVSLGRYITGARRPAWGVLRKIRDQTGGRVSADDFMDPPIPGAVKRRSGRARVPEGAVK